jgi:hypothetical protein
MQAARPSQRHRVHLANLGTHRDVKGLAPSLGPMAVSTLGTSPALSFGPMRMLASSEKPPPCSH